MPELEEQSANVLQETDAAVKRADAVRAHAEKGECCNKFVEQRQAGPPWFAKLVLLLILPSLPCTRRTVHARCAANTVACPHGTGKCKCCRGMCQRHGNRIHCNTPTVTWHFCPPLLWAPQFDNLQQFDSDRLGGTAFQLLQDVKEVVSVVAHVTVPPPGGQIIAAAIQLTVLVIDGAKNIGVCQRLAQRCNRMVHLVYGRGQGEGTLLKAPKSLQQSLNRLKDVCIEVITFAEEIVNQNWFQGLWACKTTAQRLEELNNELMLAQGKLQTALGRAAYDSNAKAQLAMDELKDDMRTIRDRGPACGGSVVSIWHC